MNAQNTTDLSMLDKPENPKDKSLEALQEWRDCKQVDSFDHEALDSVIEYLQHEVDQ